MAKKIDDNTPEVIEIESGEHHSANPVFLKMGAWRHLFSEHQRKIIIAEALNTGINDEKLSISGYLITGWSVCLVLMTHKKQLHKILEFFDEYVRKEIAKYHRELEEHNLRIYHEDDPFLSVMHKDELFEPYMEENDYLVRLITGREVKQLYYDPHVARLKDIVNNERFCSAIDYSGAMGPVMVKLRYHDDLMD